MSFSARGIHFRALDFATDVFFARRSLLLVTAESFSRSAFGAGSAPWFHRRIGFLWYRAWSDAPKIGFPAPVPTGLHFLLSLGVRALGRDSPSRASLSAA
jgi:hypothetical protein